MAARLAFGVLVAAACSSAEEVAQVGVGSTCALASECAAPLVCVFARCHQECSQSRDCPAEQSCVLVDKPRAVCQLPVERDCQFTSDCPQPLVCAVDGQCRSQCQADVDCLGGQVCASGTCADPEELVDGRLPNDDPAPGEPCAFDSDCPEEMHCKKGQCVFDCITSADCPANAACVANRCVTPQGGPPCVPGEQPHCTCADGADGVKVCGDDFVFSECLCPGKPSGSGGAGGAPSSSSSGGPASSSGPGNGGGPASSSSSSSGPGNGGGPASSSSSSSSGPGNGGGIPVDASFDVDIIKDAQVRGRWIGTDGGAVTGSTALPGVRHARLGGDASGPTLTAAPDGRGGKAPALVDADALLLVDVLVGEAVSVPAATFVGPGAPLLAGPPSLRAMSQGGPGWVALAGAVPAVAFGDASDEGHAFVVAVALPDGAPAWRASLSGGDADPTAVAMDADGGAVVVGSFSGALRVGRRVVRTAGERAGFAARFERDGALAWLVRLGDGGRVDPHAVALGKDAAGALDGTVWIAGAAAGSTSGDTDALLLRLDARGATIGDERWGGAGVQVATALAVAADGSVAIAGHVDPASAPLRVAGRTLTPGRGGDAFVASFGANLGLRFARLLGEPGGQIDALAFDAAGDMLLAGASGGDALVLKLGDAGVVRWLRTFGDDVEQRATSVVAADGDVVMATVVTEGEGLDLGAGYHAGQTLLVGLEP